MKIKNFIVIAVTSVFMLLVSGFLLFGSAEEFSLSERRELAQMPEFSFSSFKSGKFMKDFDKFTADQLPLRDSFRTLKAYAAKYLFGQGDNNGIYIYNGYAAKMEAPENAESAENAAKKIKELYDRYLSSSDGKIIFSVIPDKNCYLAEKSGHLTVDPQFFADKISAANPEIDYVDISDLLDETDFYFTDTHWRQEKIYDVAKRLAENLGITLTAGYEEKTLDVPFYGVYSGQSALPLDAEEIKYLTNEALESCRVFDWQNNKETSVYDMEKANGKDPYEMFLSGPLSLVTLENPNASTDKELVIFRDSFGSSIAPFFAEGYSKITLVDTRYIQPQILDKWVDFSSCDVLFIYSTLVLNNSNTLK